MSVFLTRHLNSVLGIVCIGVSTLVITSGAHAEDVKPVVIDVSDVELVEAAPTEESTTGGVPPAVQPVEGSQQIPPDDKALDSYTEEFTSTERSNSIAISGPTATDAAAAEEFFDANDLVPVPSGEMSKESPVKLSPSKQPASKLVTVVKDYEADSQTAQLVSAERAMTLGLYDSALQMFETLSANNPKDPRILMGKAVTLQKLERFDEAMQTYDVLSQVQPKNLDVKINMLGLLGTKYPAVALRQLLDLHGGNPSHVGLTAQIAIAYANAGDTTSALRYLGMASSMEPDNANHIFNMAVLADRSGDEGKAVEYYEQALEIDSVHGGNNTIPRDAIYERLSGIR